MSPLSLHNVLHLFRQIHRKYNIMKNTLLIIGIILVAINAICALIISDYSWVNAGASSVVIILNLFFLCRVCTVGLKDGYKYSLSVFLPILGVIEFLCSAFSAPQFEDNYGFVAALCLIVLQILCLLACNKVSKRVH